MLHHGCVTLAKLSPQDSPELWWTHDTCFWTDGMFLTLPVPVGICNALRCGHCCALLFPWPLKASYLCHPREARAPPTECMVCWPNGEMGCGDMSGASSWTCHTPVSALLVIALYPIWTRPPSSLLKEISIGGIFCGLSRTLSKGKDQGPFFALCPLERGVASVLCNTVTIFK